jgi:hypothetical protein
MCLHFLYARVKVIGIVEFLISIFRSKCQPLVGGQVKVGTAQIFIPVSFSEHGCSTESRIIGDLKASAGKLRSRVYHLRELLIHSSTIDPRLSCVAIVKKLIESGNLSRLKGLVRNQGSFKSTEYGTTHSRTVERRPGYTEFGVEPILIQILLINSFVIRFVKVAACANSECHVSQGFDIGIEISIVMINI